MQGESVGLGDAFPYLLADNPDYAEKARRISALCKDLAQVLSIEDLSALKLYAKEAVAFHCPCTLQHGQTLSGVTETLLQTLGFELKPVANGHICCGSAGTYSILQLALSQQLLSDKVAVLEASGAPRRLSPRLMLVASCICPPQPTHR